MTSPDVARAWIEHMRALLRGEHPCAPDNDAFGVADDPFLQRRDGPDRDPQGGQQ